MKAFRLPVISATKAETTLAKPKGYSWDLFRDGVTQGLLSNFLVCPERTRLGYMRGLRSVKEKPYIHFGNVVHEAIEKVYAQIPIWKAEGYWATELVRTAPISYAKDLLHMAQKRDLQRVYTEGSAYPDEASDITKNCLTAE